MKQQLITGGSGGIGQAIIERIQPLGDEIVNVSRHANSAYADAPFYRHESVDFEQIEALEPPFKRIAKTVPGLNTLILCAGIGLFQGIEQFSLAQMQRIMNINFLSQALLIKTLLPILKRHGTGTIIVIGSEAALNGAKYSTLYSASKFALRGFCQSLRQECKSRGISVNLINPGLTDTAFFDALHFKPGTLADNHLLPSQIADAVGLILANPHPGCFEEINLAPLVNGVRS